MRSAHKHVEAKRQCGRNTCKHSHIHLHGNRAYTQTIRASKNFNRICSILENYRNNSKAKVIESPFGINYSSSSESTFCEIMPKRQCIFTAELKKKYLYFTTTNSESDLRCNICSGSINIGCKGRNEIERYLTTAKHKKALNAASITRSVGNFFPSKIDYHMAACEGVWAYHVIQSNTVSDHPTAHRKYSGRASKFANSIVREPNVKP